MRILVLGAGAIGGYFGGRLAAGGADVTFLVRPRRKQVLGEHGLIVKSPVGYIVVPVVTTLASEIKGPYDVVLLTAKAYDLASAIDAVAPAMGPKSVVLPLLNGLLHLDALAERFGRERVLGGTCYIGASLSSEGHVIHKGPLAVITFGELDGGRAERTQALATEFQKGNFKTVLSDRIRGDMWDKFVMLATLAAVTTVTHANVGEIMAAPEGERTMLTALSECEAVAAANGSPLSTEARDRTRTMLTDRASAFSASMRHDMEAGGRTEGEHILGDMVRCGGATGVATPLLRMALCNLQIYEARRPKG